MNKELNFREILELMLLSPVVMLVAMCDLNWNLMWFYLVDRRNLNYRLSLLDALRVEILNLTKNLWLSAALDFLTCLTFNEAAVEVVDRVKLVLRWDFWAFGTLKNYNKNPRNFNLSKTWFLIQFGQIEIERLALFALQRWCSALILRDLDC